MTKKVTKVIIILLMGAVITTGIFLLSSQPTQPTAPLSDLLILGNDFQVYRNEKYNFSLEYPKDYRIETFQEKDGAETIVFQGIATALSAPRNDEKDGFQIFITPFEGGTQLTKERILKDIPGAILKNVQEAIIGTATGQNIKALLFWSEDPLIGRTREIWFVHAGHLYEITTYAEMDNLLAGIMSTWE